MSRQYKGLYTLFSQLLVRGLPDEGLFLQLKERLAQPEMPIVEEPVQESTSTGGYVELGVSQDTHDPQDHHGTTCSGRF